jgi:ribokinase
MWGCVGRDEAGAAAVAGLVEAGVDVSAVSRSPARPTGSALIVVDEAGENSITVAPGANGDLSPAALVDLADRAPAADVLLLQLEVPLSTCVAAARAAAATSVRVVLNAAPLPGDPATLGELLRLVDVLVVNETEAAGLAGAESVDGEGLLPVARALRRTGPSLVVVTLGAAGALVAGESLEGHVPGVAVDAVDSVGAGDSFCAALAVSLAVDPDPVLAVRRACAAGALAVTRPGAQPSLPTRAEVEGLLSEVDARGPRRAP